MRTIDWCGHESTGPTASSETNLQGTCCADARPIRWCEGSSRWRSSADARTSDHASAFIFAPSRQQPPQIQYESHLRRYEDERGKQRVKEAKRGQPNARSVDHDRSGEVCPDDATGPSGDC